MAGPIFISHASADGDDVTSLAVALRGALADQVRTFNTSSGTAIPPGATWRERILEAIDAASLVILWATPAALSSREVAFEIGAAFAFGREVVPCCVNISPSELPWSLSERQALAMNADSSWRTLTEKVANTVNYSGQVDESHLSGLADRFHASSDALELVALGQSIQLHNSSASVIRNLVFRSANGGSGRLPSWAAGHEDRELSGGESLFLLRDPVEPACELEVTWSDVNGVSHHRVLAVPATTGSEEVD